MIRSLQAASHDAVRGIGTRAAFMSASPSNTHDIFSGGGEMGDRMRAMDWAATPLGPVAAWPQSLKTCVRIVLTSRQPMFVWWGAELINLYNDAYKSIVGGKHPEALGQPASVVWREIWNDVLPRAESAMLKNEGTYDEALLLIMERYGYAEETYYTFAYSPVPNDEGGIGGILCSNTDDTQRIISERQLALLRELAASTLNTRTVVEACEQSVLALHANRRDLPFAIIYLHDEKERALKLAGVSGIHAGHEAVPVVVRLGEESFWPYADVLREHLPRTVDLTGAFSDLPSGPWDVPPRQAAVLPLTTGGEVGHAGVLVVGLNPLRQYNDLYEGFINLVAGQISASMAGALTFEEEKRRAEALAEIDRTKTAFFSNVSHEFRTPLTLMLGPLEDSLQQPEEAMSPVVRGELQLVHRNSLRLLKLVNALLDFSRIEAGRTHAVFEPLDLAACTAELASTFRSAIEKAGMKLEVDCTPLSEPVHADREMWEKIVLNLLSNAYKHTFEGGIQVRVREVEGAAQLQVRDTGSGIPPEAVPKLFERFFRVEGAPSRTHEGSGIGLSLVEELVKLHGGTIAVESTAGQGSTFTVTLPFGGSHLPQDRIGRRQSSGSTSRQSQSYLQEALRWMAPESTNHPVFDIPPAHMPRTREDPLPRVVVADDNADMRDYLLHLLSPSYRVELVEHGEAALAAIRREPADLVLTDIMMPGMDGFGLLHTLRSSATTQDIPIIMLSARAGEAARIEGINAGADDYLVKPFSARELLARVAASLRLVRLRRENAARVENILECTSDAFVAVDAQWRITHANGVYRRLFEGFSEPGQDLPGQDFWEQIPGLEESEAGARCRGAMESQRPDSFELNFEPLGMQLEVRVFPSPDLLSMYMRDITDRTRTEQALRDARDRIRATLKAAEIGTWVWDMESDAVTADENMGRLFALEAAGRPAPITEFMKAMHPEDAPRVWQDIQETLSGVRSDFESDYRLIQRDGSVRWVTARGHVQRNSEGTPVRFPGVLLDITARKEIEHALRDSELRFRAIFNQASTFIAIVSPGGMLLDANDAAIAAAAVDREKLLGRPFWDAVWWRHDPIVQRDVRKSLEAAAGGAASHFQGPMFNVGGERRVEDLHITPLIDSGSIAFILVEGRDITDLVEAKRALEQARDSAERANQTKDDFLASLSHELRTPLNPALLIATEAAGNRAYPADARQDFDTIAKNVQLEARLIDDLLDLTLITRGKMPLDMGPRDAHGIMRDAISTVHMELEQKSIMLTIHLAARHHQVWGDAVRLQQVLWNVLKNAIKFTPVGGSITITTANAGPEDDIVIEIKDSGIGMTDPELARVFDYFAQGEHASPGGSHKFGGLGLGLAISRMLVELHAGTIQASSRGRHQGTTISVKLATTKVTASGRVTIPEEFREAQPVIVLEDEPRQNLRILLVEDHEPTRVALTHLLKRRKHEVTPAGSVAEARAAASTSQFDLVMSDIGLPDGTGNDLMKELRAMYGLRGIALTGYGMSEDIARTQAAGFMAHLTKPISVQALDHALLNALDRLG